jgi:hypothetical protein
VPSFTDSLTVESLLAFSSQVSAGASAAIAAGTLVLTSASNCLYIFTGTVAGQIVQLPDATTVPLGWKHEFCNLSNQLIQINDAAGNFLTYISSQQNSNITLQVDGTIAGTWITQLLNIGFNKNGGATLYDEFMGNSSNALITGSLNWGIKNLGTGSSVSAAAPVSGHPGIIQLTTQRNGNSSSLIALSPILLGAGQWTFEGVVEVPVLSSGPDQFVFQFGFGDNLGSVNADPNNGVFFEYSQAASTFWRYRAGKASTYTSLNSTVTVIAGAWYKLRFVVNTIDTSIQFYISAAGGGALTSVGSITTNIPVSGVAPFFQMRKSAGNTTLTSLIDSALVDFNLVAAR